MQCGAVVSPFNHFREAWTGRFRRAQEVLARTEFHGICMNPKHPTEIVQGPWVHGKGIFQNTDRLAHDGLLYAVWQGAAQCCEPVAIFAKRYGKIKLRIAALLVGRHFLCIFELSPQLHLQHLKHERIQTCFPINVMPLVCNWDSWTSSTLYVLYTKQINTNIYKQPCANIYIYIYDICK